MMHSVVAAVSAIVAATSPGPASAATAAPAAAPPVVLRRLTYKVSYSTRRESTVGTFGGQQSDNMDHPIDTAKPQTIVTSDHDEGTLDVEVTAVASDGIALRVAEHWNARGASATFTGIVLNDGTPMFGSQQLGYPTRYVIAYLGPKIAQDHAVVPGAHWVTTVHPPQADISTTFTVKDQQDEVAVVDEVQSIHVRAAQGVDVTTQGSVRYKPAKLVGLSGTLEERQAITAPSRVDRTITDIQFERLSDTLDR